MKDGFVRAAAAAPAILPGNCEYNKESIIESIRKAAERGAKLIALPELCVTGSTCGDMFMHSTLLNSAESALEEIADRTAQLDAVCVCGLPHRMNGVLYNSAAVFTKGRILGFVRKRELTADERRYFAAGGDAAQFVCVNYPDLAFEVCVGGDKPLTNAEITVNIDAKPFAAGMSGKRRAALSVHSGERHCTIVYANAGDGESTASAVYDGYTAVAENGKILSESGIFGTGCTTAVTDLGFLSYERRRAGVSGYSGETVGFTLLPEDTVLDTGIRRFPFVPDDARELACRCEEILAAQSAGLAKRMKHTHAAKAVIGVSGGLDSTLALIVCTKAAQLAGLGKADVAAVTMPCFGTTNRTKSNAGKLCEQLGVTFREVNITKAVEQHLSDISHDPGNMNAAYENAQARERTQVLMDIANDENGLVVGTGDLSELALGWATYGGDQMSMYGVNAGLPKTLIQRIVGHYADVCGNAELAEVLRDIVATPISPELLPGQKTEDSVGPYELHDFFLYHMIRRGCPPRKLYRLAKAAFAGDYDNGTILKWLRVFVKRFFAQQFKRSCSPDGIGTGSVSLSPDRLRLPSDISGELWIKEAGELKE